MHPLPTMLPCAGDPSAPMIRAIAEYPARIAAAVALWHRLEAAGCIRDVPDVPCPPTVDDGPDLLPLTEADGAPSVHLET